MGIDWVLLLAMLTVFEVTSQKNGQTKTEVITAQSEAVITDLWEQNDYGELVSVHPHGEYNPRSFVEVRNEILQNS